MAQLIPRERSANVRSLRLERFVVVCQSMPQLGLLQDHRPSKRFFVDRPGRNLFGESTGHVIVDLNVGELLQAEVPDYPNHRLQPVAFCFECADRNARLAKLQPPSTGLLQGPFRHMCRHGPVLEIIKEVSAEVFSFLPIVFAGLLLAPDTIGILVAKSEDVATAVKAVAFSSHVFSSDLPLKARCSCLCDRSLA